MVWSSWLGTIPWGSPRGLGTLGLGVNFHLRRREDPRLQAVICPITITTTQPHHADLRKTGLSHSHGTDRRTRAFPNGFFSFQPRTGEPGFEKMTTRQRQVRWRRLHLNSALNNRNLKYTLSVPVRGGSQGEEYS
jgi:hypothetical protein